MTIAYSCEESRGKTPVTITRSDFMKLEEIRVNSSVRGILPNSAVTIKHVQMFGNEALEVTYVDGEGKASTQLLFRDQEPNLELVLQTRPLSFTADGHLFRLASEAQRLS